MMRWSSPLPRSSNAWPVAVFVIAYLCVVAILIAPKGYFVEPPVAGPSERVVADR